jgi:hypothetical protein
MHEHKKPWTPPAITSQRTFERMALICTGSPSPICNGVLPPSRRNLRPKETAASQCQTPGQCNANLPGQS